MNASPKEAARKFAAPMLDKGFKPQALHTYRSEAGKDLFYRIRMKHPDTGEKWIRPMHLNGEGWTIGEPKFDNGKPLYNLPALAAAPSDAIGFVVEGEPKVDALAALGLIATTSGAADSADRADWSPCTRLREWRVWPDNDEAGQRYADHVVSLLTRAGCRATKLDVSGLDLPPKGDAVDWLRGHPEATAEDVLALRCTERAVAHAADPDEPNHAQAPKSAPSPLAARLEAPNWPDDLDGAAFCGLAGDITRAIAPHTEADEAAVLLQVLIAFGALAGRNNHVLIEADRHYPQLFGLVVGDSAVARKGTSWGRVRQIFEALPGWPKVVDGLSSGEGLKYAVRDPIEKTTKNNDREVVDEGVHDKRLLVVEAEFAQVLRQCARAGNTLSSTLRSAWDTGRLTTLTKNDPVTATGAHISIIGHITAQELKAELTQTDAANGFANRFIFQCARRSKMLPRGGGDLAEDVLADLRRRLSEAATRASQLRTVERSAAYFARWDAVYPVLSTPPGGLSGSILARGAAQVTRLALIYALMDAASQVEERHLLAALALWDRAEASAKWIFGNALGDRVADEILRAVRASSCPLNRTEISRIFKGHEPVERINGAIALLTAKGLIRRTASAPTGGRPAEQWEAA